MHIQTLEPWQHSHNFVVNQERAEKKTRIVMVLTAVTMVVEIVAGTIFGSMALLADGWHMATHIAAFGIAVFAYQYARSHADDPQYTFGTGKVSVLGGFASAVVLSVVVLLMTLESLTRLFQPETIQFNEALGVGAIGLIVNLASALLLQDDHHHHLPHHDGHHHHHDGHHHHRHRHHHPDRNLHAAYIHVVADVLTSVLAIVALFAGKFLGWVWMLNKNKPVALDPFMNQAQLLQNKATDFGEVALDKIDDVLDEYQKLLPYMEELGLEIEGLSIEVGLLPKIKTSLVASLDAIEVEAVERVKTDNKTNQLLVSILNAVLLANKCNDRSLR